jgi:two-component system, NarL family, nitrate/nitrite response regulator NarL
MGIPEGSPSPSPGLDYLEIDRSTIRNVVLRIPAPAPPIRIVVVEHHPLIREGISSLLSQQSDFQVVGQGTNGSDALRLARECDPDVLLLDHVMPGLSAVAVARELRSGNVPVRIILLSPGVEKGSTLAILKTGVRGIVLKDSRSELLVKSIRKVHDGQVWIGRDAMSDILEALTESEAASKPEPLNEISLTPRERQILGCILAGETNKRIARALEIGEDTVKHHLTSIFDKTGASNRLELALFALHHGFVHGSGGDRLAPTKVGVARAIRVTATPPSGYCRAR